MRRLLAIGAVSALIFAAVALVGGRNLSRVSAQSSNSGTLSLVSIGNRYDGCPLGTAYTFCDQPPSTASQAIPFSVQSSAAVTGVSVALGPINGLSANFAAGDFTISGNTCTGNLAANGQCEIDVQFSPTTTGLRQAALNVTDSQGDALAVNLQGSGSNLALSPPYGVSPGVPDNSFNYAGVPVNTASGPQSFTVSAGAAVTSITVSLAPISGLESEFASGGADFLETNNCGALAAGGACTVSVTFTPTTVGLRSAALTAKDAEGDTTTLFLSGYGNNGRGGTTQAGGLSFAFTMPGSNPAACARLNYFGFCNEPAGGVSPISSTFTLQNTTPAPGTQITGLTVPTGSIIAQGATAPDFTVQSNSCSSVLDAGASCNITVAFTPTTSGLHQGAIVVTDAQGDVATVNLAGVGDDYSIAPQLPTEISVIPGDTATFNATLTPDNVLGMNGEQVTFTCPTNLPTNTSCAVTPCPAAITPGTPVSVQVVLVTSSIKTVASKPTEGCSSYGPSQAALIPAPRGDRGDPPSAAPGASRSSPLYPSLLVFAAFGAMTLLMVGFAAPGSAIWRRRVPLMLACAGLAAAILAGCRHHTPTNTTATPTGITNLIAHGEALDAGGLSLNASRQFQVTLDVVSK